MFAYPLTERRYRTIVEELTHRNWRTGPAAEG
jgi:hypothetical protein